METLNNAYAIERQRQLEMIESQIKNKEKEMEEHKKRVEEEKKKAEEAERLRLIEEERRNKAIAEKTEKLIKTLELGQQMIYKQSYSKPLMHFNASLASLETQTWLESADPTKNEKKVEFHKTVLADLLEKVNKLEVQVKDDIHRVKHQHDKPRDERSGLSKKKIANMLNVAKGHKF